MIIYKNIIFHRGDKEAIRIDYPGDISSHDLTFVLKRDRELTSSRLIEIAGNCFSNNESFIAVYDISKKVTQITIIPDIKDTQDLYGNFVFDIYDATDSVTRADGNFYVEPDVQTPYDGTNLPVDGKRYVPYYPENFNDKEILQYDSAICEFKGKAPGALIDENFYNKTEVNESLSRKVDMENGKGLSTNDFTNELKTGAINSINNLGGVNILNQTLIEWTENEAFQLLSRTVDSNGIITISTVQWPDGSTGMFTATAINNIWLAIDACIITHVLSGKSVIQSLVARDTCGNIINKPPLTVA